MTVLQWAGAVLMVVGGVLSLVAGLGMLLLPDVAARLQAATKPQVVALVLIVLGAMPMLGWWSGVALLLLVAVAQLIIAPVLGQLVARSAYRAGSWRRDLLLVDELGEIAGDRANDAPPDAGRRPLH